MRKTQKEQFIGLLNTLGQAHDEIKSNIEHARMDAAINLMLDCQQCAITLGGIIEEAEGEGFCTVTLLEQYCEILYQIYEKLSENEDITSVKAYKLLNQSLIKINNSVKNDIQVRKEAVFLPYKASMWDSLESVWEKLDADPEWDAYVVPIPYYDKNPDGSFRQMYYEVGDYPEYVPVTDYMTFNLEARHPDRIYIHNPYDEYNYVTSVEPAFYSKVIKNYTDELVYIPYFVCIDDNVPEHFIVLPGTIHAHKVIVQSEKVKEAYIEGFRKYADENNIDIGVFGNLEDKFQALGSPKMDKLKNFQRENIQIPDNWKTFLADGKKIVFYNTTIQAFLDNSDGYLDKMHRVFDTFLKYRDKIVLLWRPHPLMKDTIKSMHPELYGRYIEVVKEYSCQGWGIYDDTPDIDRAIALSDAYYGDMSSVVELYKVTGKPIMIQNLEI